MDAPKVMFVPYFNVLNIPMGNTVSSRTSSAIDIKSIEVTFSLRPNPANTMATNTTTPNLGASPITDGRVRVIGVL